MDYMVRNGSRTVQISKSKLIEKIRENKKNHIESYEKAVIAYKKKALTQLEELKIAAENGDIKLRLDLTTPIDNSKHYDSIIEMFEWEERDSVELSQQEFNEYVQDKTESSRIASMSNTMYLG
jgi:enoyl reductase-like protein